MKKTLLLLMTLLVCLPVHAKISFSAASLNQKDELLFSVRQDMPGTESYSSVFYSRIKDGLPESQPQILTCYPEQLELLSGGKVLQLRNRYGFARYNIESDTLLWTKYTQGMPVNSLPVLPYAASPDGKWFCRIERENFTTGFLVVENAETGISEILCENVRLSYDSVPVKWAPDGSVLIYEKNGDVYFCNPEAVVRGVEMDEKYRKIGRGTINSVHWASAKYLAYIDDYLVYRINARELYTLGLYSGVIGQGKIVGRLPFQFDPQADKFSTSESVFSIVIVQNGRIFSALSTERMSAEYLHVDYSHPYSDSDASLLDSYVFWGKANVPVLWLEKLPYDGGAERAALYRLSAADAGRMLEIEDAGKPIVSPDGTKAAFFSGSTVFVYDINTWKKIGSLGGEKVVSAVWAGSNVLYVGGERTIRKWNAVTNASQVVLLSSAQAAYWDSLSGGIIADNGNREFYIFDDAHRNWKRISLAEAPEPEIQNGRYRVYTGTTANANFENALYIRSLTKKAVTKPVYDESAKKVAAPKKIALVFDAYDNSDGVSKIISTLRRFNIRGSFFINGEFIRRYPSETKQIVRNGHECGSMFFSTTDLTNRTFVIDEDFIRRGLARNEDEFFDCTGEELSLYWHAPFYATNSEIITAGEKAGYAYIHSAHVHSDTTRIFKRISPDQLIQEYYNQSEKSGGGIIPVAAGFTQDNRSEPLYDSLDLLICALIEGGFEFVTVTGL